MKVFRTFVFLLGHGLFLSSVGAVDVSFDSIRSFVEKKNEKVLSQKENLRASRLRKGGLLRSYLPKLSLEGGQESFEVGTRFSDQQPFYGVEARLNLYNGGRDALKGQSQNLASERHENLLKIALAEELGEAREVFWKIVYLREEAILLKDMQKKNTKNLQAANRRIRSGVATPSDRLEFQMKALDLARALRNAETGIKALSFDLLVHLGFGMNQPLRIVGDLAHSDEWEQEFRHDHGDHDFFVKPSQLLAEELELRSSVKWRAQLPQLDLYAGWYQFTQREESADTVGERRESVVGVWATLDLFDGFSIRRESQALLAEAQAAQALSRFTKNQNEAHIEQEFIELKSLHNQAHEVEKHIALAMKYYRATQKEYSRGAKNSPDVLGATERLEEVRREKNRILRDFHIARSHVLSKIGK